MGGGRASARWVGSKGQCIHLNHTLSDSISMTMSSIYLAVIFSLMIAAGGEPMVVDGSQEQESGVSASAGGLEIILQGDGSRGKGKRCVLFCIRSGHTLSA